MLHSTYVVHFYVDANTYRQIDNSRHLHKKKHKSHILINSLLKIYFDIKNKNNGNLLALWKIFVTFFCH